MVLPYLKGFLIIKCGFHIFFLDLFWCIFYSYIWFLTSGIRALSLARSVGNFFFFFLHIFSEKKKRDATFWTIYVYFCAKFAEMVVYLSSSQKNTQFKKKKLSETESGKSRYRHFKICNFSGFFPWTTT
jgi:hypothetical protein